MRFIIEKPIIEQEPSGAYLIKLHASLESAPNENYSIQHSNINKADIRMYLDRCFETLARKIATHYLPYE